MKSINMLSKVCITFTALVFLVDTQLKNSSTRCTVTGFIVPSSSIHKRTTNVASLRINDSRSVLVSSSSSTRTSSYNNNNNKSNINDNRNNTDRKKSTSTTSTSKKTDNNASEVLKAHNHFFSQKSTSDVVDRCFATATDKNKKENKNIKDKKDLLFKLCQAASLDRPSKIQYLAWPILLEGKHVIIGDQTGSGKTLGYLLPLLHRMISKTKEEEGTGASTSKSSPRIIILTPTAELAQQVSKVCKSVSSYTPFSTMCITAVDDDKTPLAKQIQDIKRRSKNTDVIVSTPGRLATLIRSKAIDTSRVSGIVLDEVDVLLIDETFGPQLRTLGNGLTENTQFVFVTATLPKLVIDKVTQEFRDVQVVKGPGLHRVAPTLKEELVDVSVPRYESNRNLKACLDIKTESLLESIRNFKCARTLIFCNTVQSCRAVENLLSRHDRNNKLFQVNSYHGAMSNTARKENLQAFVSSDKDNTAQLLVCTDRAARGVDFAGKPVDHVIVYDFPKDPAEYLRRVGRTARAGRHGRCTVFAYGWQLPLARKIMGKKPIDTDFTEGSMDSSRYDDEEDSDDFFELANPKRRLPQALQKQKPLKNKSGKNKWKEQDEVIGDCIEKGMLWR